MKRILFTIALFSSVLLSAQTVIVEEKYEKKNEPVDFKYLPNSKKFVVFKGETLPIGAVSSSTIFFMTKSAYSFDENGKKSTLFENEKLANCTFSITENSFKSFGGDKLSVNSDRKYYLNNIYNNSIPNNDLKNINSSYFGFISSSNQFISHVSNYFHGLFFNSFNDFYELGFTNQKEKDNINFEKDDVYLEVFDIKTKQKNRFKLEVPSLTLLKGNSFIESGTDITFKCKLTGNDSFDLITKSVNIDQKSSVLYKSSYDMKGKKIRDIYFKLDFKDHFFICSNNFGGEINVEDFNISSINNYYEDRVTGDVFIYGLFNDKKSKVYKSIYPAGFYIFKFDKDGNKIWESINAINDKEYFNDISNAYNLMVELQEYNGKLLFTSSFNTGTEFTNYAVVDKSSGNLLKLNRVNYNQTTGYNRSRAFINNTFDKEGLKNKAFSQISFVAMDLDPKLNSYLQTIPSKGNAIYFETVFSDQGIWLIETDNKEYYKILLFKE